MPFSFADAYILATARKNWAGCAAVVSPTPETSQWDHGYYASECPATGLFYTGYVYHMDPLVISQVGDHWWKCGHLVEPPPPKHVQERLTRQRGYAGD